MCIDLVISEQYLPLTKSSCAAGVCCFVEIIKHVKKNVQENKNSLLVLVILLLLNFRHSNENAKLW